MAPPCNAPYAAVKDAIEYQGNVEISCGEFGQSVIRVQYPEPFETIDMLRTWLPRVFFHAPHHGEHVFNERSMGICRCKSMLREVAVRR